MLRGHVMLVERRGSWLSGTLLPSSWSHWLGMFCESLPPPPRHCIAMTMLCHVQKSGALGNVLPLLWPTYPCLPSPQAGEGRGWETVDPGFFSLEGLK